MTTRPILLTTGEPAGIGMDICLELLSQGTQPSTPIVMVGCLKSLRQRQAQLVRLGKLAPIQLVKCPLDGQHALLNVPLEPCIQVIDTPCVRPVVAGGLDVANAPMVLAQLSLAHTLAQEGQVRAIVTAPIQKSVMIEAGIRLDDGAIFSGHTEFFMSKCGVDKVVMMLANRVMKVALVTTHLPLKQVPNAITATQIIRTAQILHNDLVNKFAIASPKILVCGLNPHAGEDGHLGEEEQLVINPALDTLRQQGMDISYALPADTLFTPKYLQNCDAVMAMYHDQGLAPLKSHGFGETVNLTLGLPYVRTSVDHGTALDLAGTGQASSQSLAQAIVYAHKLSTHSLREQR